MSDDTTPAASGRIGRVVQRVSYALLGAVGVVLVLLAGILGLLTTEAGTRWTLEHVSEYLRGSTATDVRFEAVEGALLDHLVLRGLRVADAEGPWLTAERLTIDWRPWRLLTGDLWIDVLGGRDVAIARTPAGGDPDTTEQGGGGLDPAMLGRLTLRHLDVESLSLGEPVLGEAMRFSAEGEVIGRSLGGIGASLLVTRLDEPGEIRADVDYRVGKALGVHAVVYEPAGGALARVLGLPGLPALRLTLDGEGPVTAWEGRLSAEAEGLVQVDADLGLAVGRVSRLRLEGVVAPGAGVPPDLAALAKPEIAVAVEVRRGPDGVIGLQSLTIGADGWQASAEGSIDPAGPVALAARAQVDPSVPLEPLVGVPVGLTTVAAEVTGTVDAPRVALDLDARETVAQELAAHVEAVLGDTITLEASGSVQGVSALLPQLEPLLGQGLEWSVAGAVGPQRDHATITSLTLSGAAMSAQAEGQVVFQPAAFTGSVTAEVPSLAVLQPLVGMPLRGSAHLAAEIGEAGAEGMTGPVALTLEGFTLGQAQADALIGGDVALDARLTVAADGLTVAEATLDAGNLRLTSERIALAEFTKIDGPFVLHLPRLAALGLGLEGAATLDGRLEGTVSQPQVTAQVGIIDLVAQGMPVGAASAQASLTAGQVAVRDLQAAVWGTALSGGVTVDFASGLLAGDVVATVSAPDALTAATGVTVARGTRATLKLGTAEGVQTVSLTAAVDGLAMTDAGVTVGALDVESLVRDPFGTARGRVGVAVGPGAVGTIDWRRATLDLRIDGTSLGFTLDGEGQPPGPAEVSVAGAVALGGTAPTVTVRRASFDKGRHSVALAEPMTIGFGAGLSVSPTTLRVGEGTLRIAYAVANGRIDASIQGRSLPLSIIELVQPEYGLDGSVDRLSVTVKGPLREPSGSLSLTARNLALPEAEVEGITVSAEGSLQGGRLSLDGRATGLGDQPATVAAVVPLRFGSQGVPSVPADAPMQARADWSGPVQAVWALVPQVGHQLSGALDLHASLGGSLDAPTYAGDMRLSGGRYENLEWGTVLADLDVVADLKADGSVALRASASDGGRGSVRAEGQLTNDGAGASALDARIQVEDALLSRRDDLRARVDGTLTYAGSLTAGRLSGRVAPEMVEIAVGDSLGGGGPATLNVIETGGNTVGLSEQAPGAVEASPFGSDIALDIAVDMPNRIYVRGQGLDSEWGGQLHVGGVLADPRITGQMTVRRGSFDFIGREFRLAHGEVRFNGGASIDPSLDVRAEHEAEDVTAIVAVGGSVSDLSLDLRSQPSLPRDEILSRVLFGKQFGNLGPGQAIAVAQAAGRLTGLGGGGGGGGIFALPDLLRRELGLDVLSVGGDESGPAVEAGKYIGDDVYVGVEQGAGAESGSVSVEVELTPRITLETKGSASSGANIGIQYKFDY